MKRASRQIIEKYYNRLTLDFHTNKRVAEEVAVIQSKRLRNKIAGFTTVCSCLFYNCKKAIRDALDSLAKRHKDVLHVVNSAAVR